MTSPSVSRPSLPDSGGDTRAEWIFVTGSALLLVAVLVDAERAFLALSAAAFLLLTVPLGAQLMLAIGYLSEARWVAACEAGLRRAAAMTTWASGLFLVTFVVPLNWTPPLTETRSFSATWNSPLAVALRAAFILGVWCLVARRLASFQVPAAETISKTAKRWSALFLVVFTPTLWLAAQDWIGAKAADWHSGLFPLYIFSGIFLTGTALPVLLSVATNRGTRLPIHLDTVGLLAFASCVWVYFWFSQYLLIWYAGIPSESLYFVKRTTMGWLPLLLATLFLNWILPFLLLLSSRVRSDRWILQWTLGLLLAGRWFETSLMFLPDTKGLNLGWMILDAGSALLVGVAWYWISTGNHKFNLEGS